MMVLQQILSVILMIGGVFFVVVGAIGVLRLPDFFTRLHAVSLVETMGCILIITGLIVHAGFEVVGTKLVLVLVVLIFTSPVATHALAKAAAHGGIVPKIEE